MKIFISFEDNFRDSALADGVARKLRDELPDADVVLEAAPMSQGNVVEVPVPPEIREDLLRTVAPAARLPKSAAPGGGASPVVKRRGRKAGVKALPAPPASTGAAEPERVTIKARVLKLLETGPKTALELSKALGIDTGLAGQHCYLLTRSGQAVRDEAIRGWRLTANA